MDFSRDFIALACRKGVLRFGAFVTKAGRNSPYFFNAGLFDDGASFRELCGYYARTIRASGVACDMLFGPAYKGIPLVAGTAIRLAEDGGDLPFAFDRKEELIRAAGATPAGVVIELDRMERGKGALSAVQEVKESFGIPVIAVASLEDLIGYLADSPELAANLEAVKAYREQYGISSH